MTQHLGQAQEQILAESDARTLKWTLYEAAQTQFDNYRRTLIQKIMTMKIDPKKGFFKQLDEEITKFKNSPILERIVKSVTTGQSLEEIRDKYIEEHVHQGSQVVQITQPEKGETVVENNISDEIIEVEKEVLIPALQEAQKKNEESSTQNKAEMVETPELPVEISTKDQKSKQAQKFNADDLNEKREIKDNQAQVPVSEPENQRQKLPESSVCQESQQESIIKQQEEQFKTESNQQQPLNDSSKHKVEDIKPQSLSNQQLENKTQEDTPSSEHHQITGPFQQSNKEPSPVQPIVQPEPQDANDQGRSFQGEDDRKSQHTRDTVTKSKHQSEVSRSNIGTAQVTRSQFHQKPASQTQGSVTKSHMPKSSSKENSKSQILQPNQESNEDEQRNRKTTPELTSTERLQTVQEAPEKKEESAISSNQQVVEKEEKPSNLENQVSESVSEMPAKVEQSTEQQSEVQPEEKKEEEKKIEDSSEQKVEEVNKPQPVLNQNKNKNKNKKEKKMKPT